MFASRTIRIDSVSLELGIEYRNGSPPVLWGDNAHPGDPPDIREIDVLSYQKDGGPLIDETWLKQRGWHGVLVARIWATVEKDFYPEGYDDDSSCL